MHGKFYCVTTYILSKLRKKNKAFPSEFWEFFCYTILSKNIWNSRSVKKLIHPATTSFGKIKFNSIENLGKREENGEGTDGNSS